MRPERPSARIVAWALLALAVGMLEVSSSDAQDDPPRTAPADPARARQIEQALRTLQQSLIQAGRAPRPANVPAPRASTGLVPLTDLVTGTYLGKPGGLYPGSNSRPPAHEEAGLKIAATVRPLDAKGEPADDGKIVLLALGMSNTTQEFSRFKPRADSDPAKNPKLVIVDGAQGGMTADIIARPESPRGRQFWQTVEDRLARAGVTPRQVQVVWLKEAIAVPSGEFPRHPRLLEEELAQDVRVARERFPNLKLAYLSSRIYAGYAVTPLNPEPFAYESGFAVKWLIERQIEGAPDLNFDPARGPVKAPWLAWGPYLWADGTRPRSDGLTYDQSDLALDGTHPAPSGREKVARLLLDFFKTDATARPWFLVAK
jgi:hypothetical protein